MSDQITGTVLAGGLARRMGHVDKAFIELAGRPLLDHVLARFKGQCETLIINANGEPERFDGFGLPVVADTIDGFAGPLAGVLATMEWTKEHAPQNKWVVTIPVDVPFMPVDLVVRLVAAVDAEGADMACAMTNGRTHPVVGLWPVALAENLRAAMVEEDIRRVDIWTGRFNLVQVGFEIEPVDPFFNINRPEDIEQAEKILRES